MQDESSDDEGVESGSDDQEIPDDEDSDDVEESESVGSTDDEEEEESEDNNPDISMEKRCRLLEREMGEELSEDDEERKPKKAKLKNKISDTKTMKKQESSNVRDLGAGNELSMKIREALSGFNNSSKKISSEERRTEEASCKVDKSEEHLEYDEEEQTDSESEAESDNYQSKWKKDLAEKASQSFYERQVG